MGPRHERLIQGTRQGQSADFAAETGVLLFCTELCDFFGNCEDSSVG